MRRERMMNPKCLGRSVPDTFDAKSADFTGLKMIRITRGVSFDHLVGGGEQRVRHRQPERPGGFEIDHEFELGRLHHRQIARLGALENPADIYAALAIRIAKLGGIAYEPASQDKLPLEVDRKFYGAPPARQVDRGG